MNFSSNFKVVKVKDAQTAATSAVNSTGVDMLGFHGVCFIGSIATANAGNFAGAAQSSDDGSADDYSTLAGSKALPTTNGDSFLLDVYRPAKRFVRCDVTRGASTATGDIYAVLYEGDKCPVTQGSTITGGKLVISPAEGAA